MHIILYQWLLFPLPPQVFSLYLPAPPSKDQALRVCLRQSLDRPIYFPALWRLYGVELPSRLYYLAMQTARRRDVGAMAVELKHRGLPFQRQVVYTLEYRGEYCGAYIADMVVAGKILLELKSVKEFSPVMYAQVKKILLANAYSIFVSHGMAYGQL